MHDHTDPTIHDAERRPLEQPAVYPPAVDESVVVDRHVDDDRDVVVNDNDRVSGDDVPDHVSGHVIDNEHSFKMVKDDDPEALGEIVDRKVDDHD